MDKQNGETSPAPVAPLQIHTGIFPAEDGSKLVLLRVASLGMINFDLLIAPVIARDLAKRLEERARECDSGIVSAGPGTPLPPPPGGKR